MLRFNASLPAFVFLVALLGACGVKPPETATEVVRPVRSLVLSASTDAGSLHLFPGELRARYESRLGFRVGGKLVAREVQPGDRVVAGQLLAKLDPSETAPQFASARAQKLAVETELRLAQVELRRVVDLQAKGFVSSSQVDRQQAAVDAARARLDATEAQVAQAANAAEYQLIRAEAPGVVTAVDADLGQVVAAGQSVIRVARDGEREALIHVNEALAGALKPGQAWRVRLNTPASVPGLARRPAAAGGSLEPLVEAKNGAWLDARVREVSPLAEPGTRTFAVRLSLPGLPAQSPLGLSLVAEWVRGNPALVVPATAVHSRDGKAYVWRIDEGTSTVTRVVVRLGVLSDQGAPVLEGLQSGDRIVTAGVQLLREGQKVRWSES